MRRILLLIFLVAIVAGAFYAWQHRYDYFFKGILNVQNDENSEVQSSPGNSPSATPNPSIENTPGIEINTNDCQRECRTKQGTSEYEYCREICGLGGSKDLSTDNCESHQGLIKDSCYKKKAIENKDEQICNNIFDANLKKSCQNRIVEEILN